jgi:predicted ATP-dependent endonuclease of OLD family
MVNSCTEGIVMTEHFIQDIHIKDFKCFTDFKAKGFARINLIGGKNNVGKTAFMEACFVNLHAQDIKGFVTALRDIKLMRENLNIVDGLRSDTQQFIEQSNYIFVQSNLNTSSFKVADKGGVKKYFFECNNQHVDVNVKEFSFEKRVIFGIEFIDNFGLTNNEIIRNYSTVQKKDKENSLNTILNEFDSNIEAFKVIDEKPQCKMNGKYLELTELGDGVRHLVSIVIDTLLRRATKASTKY